MSMPIDFNVFAKELYSHGYTRVVDQRQSKIPANIFAVWTRNNVKAEIKVKNNNTYYVAGQGLNDDNLEVLAIELKANNFVVTRNKQHLLVDSENDVLSGFLTFVSYIEDIEGITRRQTSARLGIEFDMDQTHLFIAKVLQLAIEHKQPWAVSRGFGGFDMIDSKILKGYSVEGRNQELNGKNAYREHVNPCDNLMRNGIRMSNEGATPEEIADMFDKNNFIVKISDEEANHLDNVLKLRTVMPEGWEFGQDPFERLNRANIVLEKKVT